MARSLAGEKTAYEELLKRVVELVRGYFINALGRRPEIFERAEDLTQEVLLSIHKKKHLYSPSRPFLPWLFAIARYRLIDGARHDKRRPALVVFEEGFDAADPSATVMPEDRRLELEELMAPLSWKQREILVLAKAQGVPLAEIAERLGMTVSAVKVTVHRALAKIRRAGGA